MEKLKQLREITGAGMVDCKKALDEAGGDIEKAVDILRKKGIAKAAKRGDRETNEGVIKLSVTNDKKIGCIVELNSETDFVSRNEKFQAFADSVVDLIQANEPTSLDELLSIKTATGTLRDDLDSFSGIIGEKIGIKKFDIIRGSYVSAYSHMNGRIGVLVALSEAEADMATDIAMQIAAANPRYLDSTEVPAVELEREKSIYREQLLKEGKPENMIDKIMGGKLAKYYSEVCLVNQEFIKDDKKKVSDVLGTVKVESFIRFSL